MAETVVPELDLAAIRRWCGERVPEHARSQVRVECEVAGRDVTIVERRVPWSEGYVSGWTRLPVARLRYLTAMC